MQNHIKYTTKTRIFTVQSSTLLSAAEFSAVSVLPDTNLINLDPLRTLIFEHMQEYEAQKKILEMIDALAKAGQLSRIKECVDIDNNNIMHEMVFTHESIIERFSALNNLYLEFKEQKEYKYAYAEKAAFFNAELARTVSFFGYASEKLKVVLYDLLEAFNDQRETPIHRAAIADNEFTRKKLVTAFESMKNELLEEMKCAAAEKAAAEERAAAAEKVAAAERAAAAEKAAAINKAASSAVSRAHARAKAVLAEEEKTVSNHAVNHVLKPIIIDRNNSRVRYTFSSHVKCRINFFKPGLEKSPNLEVPSQQALAQKKSSVSEVVQVKK